jgi:hypothetical protein
MTGHGARRTLPSPRALRAAAVLVILGLLGVVVWLGLAARTPAQRIEAAAELAAGVRLSPTVAGTTLVATQAIADFGIGAEVRLVRVRIVDEVRLDVRIETDRPLTLAGMPRLCLVGPFSAPDDAGLSDRCWGEPDLGTLLAGQLGRDEAGHHTLDAGTTLLTASLRRGDERCDYPPGRWTLELAIEPVVDGLPTSPIYVPEATFDIPFSAADVLPLVAERRYCGLASAVFREQGEPSIAR